MSTVAGYTNIEGINVVIGTYEDPASAENAVDQDESTDVSQYWLASFVNPDTGEPEILGYIDP
jgi:hypothetical protein